MANYLDYLEWRGDLTMNERPFNEVDNLILSELAYFHFDEVMSRGEAINLHEVGQRHRQLNTERGYWNNNPVHLIEPCARSKRFRNIVVSHFVDHVDKEEGVQFSAVTFHLPDRTRYVAFRGTDSTLIGWKENFDIAYMEETPAQAEAVRYLESVLKARWGEVRVGGHSKGGNLAVYAAAFCKGDTRRIREVYSNDGPGFNHMVVNHPHYQRILPKVHLIIPDSSVVAILLFNKEDKQIIRSTEEDGVRQHTPSTWMVERDHFVRSDHQTSMSMRLNELADKWMLSMSDEEKKHFISTVFEVLDSSGVSTMMELEERRWITYNAIIKAASSLSSEARHSIRDSINKLAEAGKEVFWDEARKKFEPFRHRTE